MKLHADHMARLFGAVNEHTHVFLRRPLNDSVPHVQNVVLAGLRETSHRLLLDLFRAPEQDHRVDVPLQNLARPIVSPCVCHRARPVKPEHVARDGLHLAELSGAAIRMENEWGIRILGLDAGDDALRVRGRKLGKLLRGEVVCPRVKQLHDLCTRLDLIADIIRQLIGQMRQHRVQQRRVVHHHLLRLGAVPVSLALDRIRGQRPRRPDESQHGRLITHLLPQRLQSLRHERQSRRRIVQRDQPRKIVCVPDGIGNDGPRPLDHVKLDPHGRQRRQNVTEHNYTIRLERVPRLQRQLDRNGGRL
mmetsp:Transcript_3017/g.8964  ORF Transcript_3017/g.8964 Transcript_3017/m.8964 type:complete len:305 (+) Transcript_3017:501-1415(+)